MFDPMRFPDGTKKRRHHNNKGERQIRLGKTVDQVKSIAENLQIPYVTKNKADRQKEKVAKAIEKGMEKHKEEQLMHYGLDDASRS